MSNSETGGDEATSEVVTLDLDSDVVAWLEGRGTDVSTEINRVLRDYMTSHAKSA